MIRVIIGIAVCLFSVAIATVSCLRVPRNLRGYYCPVSIPICVAGAIIGVFIVLSAI